MRLEVAAFLERSSAVRFHAYERAVFVVFVILHVIGECFLFFEGLLAYCANEIVGVGS